MRSSIGQIHVLGLTRSPPVGKWEHYLLDAILAVCYVSSITREWVFFDWGAIQSELDDLPAKEASNLTGLMEH